MNLVPRAHVTPVLLLGTRLLGNHLWRCARECYVLNAVCEFVFTPNPLKLIICKKQ